MSKESETVEVTGEVIDIANQNGNKVEDLTKRVVELEALVGIKDQLIIAGQQRIYQLENQILDLMAHIQMYAHDHDEQANDSG